MTNVTSFIACIGTQLSILARYLPLERKVYLLFKLGFEETFAVLESLMVTSNPLPRDIQLAGVRHLIPAVVRKISIQVQMN